MERLKRIAAAIIVAWFPGQTRSAPPCEVQANLPPATQCEMSAAHTWARFPVATQSSSAAAWAWASVALEVPSARAESSWRDRPAAAELGYRWKPAVNGRELHLVRPGRCDGQNCTADTLIGGLSDGAYRPWDGRRWGKVTEPPVLLPATTPEVYTRPARDS